MDRATAVALTAGVGALVGVQAPMNALLGRAVGSWPATTVNFCVGTLALVALTLVVGGGYGRAGAIGSAPWYAIVGGGLCGALYVGSVTITVRALGAGGVTAATIAGQLAASVALDHFGVLGLARQPITFAKVAGIALLAAGTYLVVRE